ncbi:MAG: LacI family DNA-binding transcriptional regulator, partial [Lacisediminihabitans sp.]
MVSSEQPRPILGKRRAVTITDVATRAGVSRATVGYTLTTPNRVSDEVRERVEKVIEELGYKGNAAARQLRKGRSSAIALIVSNAANPVFAVVAGGAERESARQGGFMLLANSAEDVQRERDYIGFFESQGVSGILIAPVLDVPPELSELQSRGTPFVLIGIQPGPHSYPSISGDDEQGGYMAAMHLIDQGRRRLAFIGGPYRQINNRYKG